MPSTPELAAAFPAPESLLQILTRCPDPAACCVAFSGGLDSTVLLHSLAAVRARLPAPLRAVHADHGLQPDSAIWAEHCAAVCRELDVPLSTVRLGVSPQPGESLEAVARDARYGAFREVLPPRTCLLTAHHRDDQVETLLLQMLRGSGVGGLAAMPQLTTWGSGWLARPFLDTERSVLARYAQAHALAWVEDPSNVEEDFDRNFLRRQVTPVLARRWPGYRATLARSAALCGETAELVRDCARSDLAGLLPGGGTCLPLAGLEALNEPRRRELLRAWFADNGAPAMDRGRLAQIFDCVIAARPDAIPELRWGGWCLRRFRGVLWLMRDLPGVASGQPDIPWSGEPLPLPGGLGVMRRRQVAGGIPDTCWDQGRVSLSWRSADWRCRLPGREGSRTLKKLGQELGIPPWVRRSLPMLLVDGQPAALADYSLCEPYGGGAETGWVPQWDAPTGWR